MVWFTAFCTRVAPLGEQNSLDDATGVELETYRGRAVAFLAKAGAAFTALPAAMASVPPPDFEHGDEFATKIVAAFGRVGPQVTALAEEVKTKQADSANELSDYASDAFDDIGDTMGQDVNFDFDDKTQDAISEIPACSVIFN